MSDLDRLFYWRGIAADYFNYRGEYVNVPLENRINLLNAMGVDTGDAEGVAKEAYRLDVEPWQHWLSKTIVEPAGEGASFEINFRPDDQSREFEWELFDDSGQRLHSNMFNYQGLEETGEYLYDGARYSRRRVYLGKHCAGYYSLVVRSGDLTERAVLALYPDQVYDLAPNKKIWGVIVQLYTLRSNRNWGLGDFTDLKVLIKKLAELGADTVGLNPLHTLSPDLETHFSPYNPSDRRFLNPLYIDPDNVLDFDDTLRAGLDQCLLENLRSAKHVDYKKIRDLKYSSFQGMFKSFVNNEIKENTERASAFFSYVRNRGKNLWKFAYFEARHQKWKNALFVMKDNYEFEDIECALSSVKNNSLAPSQLVVLFHCYLQWIAEIQLEECQEASRRFGMKVGIIRDLAVGADGGGSEVWSNESLFCKSSSVGAPPDPFAQTGQNWGMPPIIPSELRNSGYEHFIELLRTNMAHCGALRIDHAMSLMRLWWCPPDKTAAYGAYVYYPFREMLGLLTLESHINRCMIIGEDLGVVPDEFRETIAQAKVITNKVFYFEKSPDRKFKVPEDYDENALAMVNNHDVPTLVSWWNRTDLSLRNELGLLEEGIDYHDVCAERNDDKAQLLSMLFDYGCYPAGWHGKPIESEADRELIDAIILFLSRVNSRIFVMQLEDLQMMDEPVNVPGTFHQHANWQRKLSCSTDQMFSRKPLINLLSQIDQQRKKQSN